MNNNQQIFKFFATQFEADIHIGIEYNFQINILLTDTAFISAVRNMDSNKKYFTVHNTTFTNRFRNSNPKPNRRLHASL